MNLLMIILLVMVLMSLSGWGYGTYYAGAGAGAGPAPWVNPIGVLGAILLIGFILMLLFGSPFGGVALPVR